jgi:hypothetical protein
MTCKPSCQSTASPPSKISKDLVKRQKEAVEKKQKVQKGLASDKDWTGEGLAKETETMVSN